MLFLCCSDAAGLAHVPYFNPHFFPTSNDKAKVTNFGSFPCFIGHAGSGGFWEGGETEGCH